MTRTHTAGSSVANPVRVLGVVRVVAGGWLITTGVTTLRQIGELLPMAQRLFDGNPGTTDAPIRALLVLITAAVLVLTGIVLAVQGFAWLPRIPLPAGGPLALAPDDVVATLVRHAPPAFGPGPSLPYWPLRRWVSDALDEMPWWRRELMGRGVRAFVRACGFALALGVLFLAAPIISTDNLLGPFPVAFVVAMLFVTAAWASLGLMLLPSHGPRIESFTLAVPTRGDGPDSDGAIVLESAPRLLQADSPVLGLTLGIFGIGVQCLIGAWWQLSPVGYPHLATSILRHGGTIAGGIVLFLLGDRMVATAAAILRRVRYESTVICVVDDVPGTAPLCHAAAVRTESRTLDGARHVVAAVGGIDAREDAERLWQAARNTK